MLVITTTFQQQLLFFPSRYWFQVAYWSAGQAHLTATNSHICLVEYRSVRFLSALLSPYTTPKNHVGLGCHAHDVGMGEQLYFLIPLAWNNRTTDRLPNDGNTFCYCHKASAIADFHHHQQNSWLMMNDCGFSPSSCEPLGFCFSPSSTDFHHSEVSVQSSHSWIPSILWIVVA